MNAHTSDYQDSYGIRVDLITIKILLDICKQSYLRILNYRFNKDVHDKYMYV